MAHDSTESGGFVLLSGISELEKARQRCWQVIDKMRQEDVLLRDFPANLKLLEHSRIPPQGVEESSFLSLHFERGHSLFPNRPETMCLFLALYVTPDQHLGTAAIRVVSLAKLMASLSFGPVEDVERKLRGYARSHGSSWDWNGDSGHRVSCFAPILDALNPEPRLTNFRVTPKEEWFAASHSGNEFDTVEDEATFYEACGVQLHAVEERIVLRPGDLLVLNNLKTIHGRLGVRRPGELHQYLFGVQDVPPSWSLAVRDRLTRELSDSQR